MTRFCFVFGCLIACALLVGCEKSPAPEFRLNAVELVKQEKLQLAEGESFDEGYQKEIGNLLTSLFGTPDKPKFPYFEGEEDPAHDIINQDYLAMAAGPVKSDEAGAPVGLYREHCAHCHGISGDGAGPTASILNPYPRDFRLGRFKFKSTPLRAPPTDHDLKTILEEGIPGTAMPSFRTLPQEELDALVHYVKYLTLRGMYERYLIGEIAALDGESIVDLSLMAESAEGDEPSDDDIDLFQEQLDIAVGEGFLDTILDRWFDTEDRITEVPPAPASIDPVHKDHQALVKTGRDLFFSKGNCAQCHGETGVGDGQLNSYDDWTSEWINTPNVDPNEPSTYADFTKVGALKPRPIRPRNLHQAVYRGGDQPSDIYLRIANGIEGTPMPASAAMTSDEIWAVVAYVRSLPFENEIDQSAKKVNQQQVAK